MEKTSTRDERERGTCAQRPTDRPPLPRPGAEDDAARERRLLRGDLEDAAADLLALCEPLADLADVAHDATRPQPIFCDHERDIDRYVSMLLRGLNTVRGQLEAMGQRYAGEE